jgi:hypothetical protein
MPVFHRFKILIVPRFEEDKKCLERLNLISEELTGTLENSVMVDQVVRSSCGESDVYSIASTSSRKKNVIRSSGGGSLSPACRTLDRDEYSSDNALLGSFSPVNVNNISAKNPGEFTLSLNSSEDGNFFCYYYYTFSAHAFIPGPVFKKKNRTHAKPIYVIHVIVLLLRCQISFEHLNL